MSDYRKTVLLEISIKNDVDLLNECGFLKNDNNSIIKECKKILLEQKEEYLEYIKNQEDSIIEKIFK